MDLERQTADFKSNFSRVKGSQLFLFWPNVMMSNEDIFRYLGDEKDL